MRRSGIVALLLVLWLVPLFSVNAWIGTKLPAKSGRGGPQSPGTSITQWVTSTRTTAPRFQFTAPSVENSHVDPIFQSYYTAHAGATILGQPLTAAFPTRQGQVQFFVAGALLLPTKRVPADANSGGFSAQLIADGLRDSASGIIQIPLLHALLDLGSMVPLASGVSSPTYASVRSVLAQNAMVSAPDHMTTEYARKSASPDVFVPETSQSGQTVGHTVAGPIWRYINRSDVSPDGWQHDVGNPLSEPIPLPAAPGSGSDDLVAQVFWRGVLLMDLQSVDATGQPKVWPADSGLAYLRTAGPPEVALTAKTPVWALGSAPVCTAPTSGNDIIHIGPNFPFALAGDSQWADGQLWYHVLWQVPHSSGSGWTPATAITFSNPGLNVVPTASFDVLSPDLAQYLASQGNNAAAVVYDATRRQYYTYNPDGQFIMASSAKVPIMLTFFTMTESQGREPDGDEMYLLTTMIENSNNDSAQALFDVIGGAPAMSNFMQSVGVPGLRPDPDAWGWSTVSPMAMVRLLTMLHDGKVLNAQDRATALNLMENIESDQQTGVGDTAPQGATVAMKDGWVQGPDGLWAMNSSGIVTVGHETYIIAVYTQEQNTLDSGWAITRQVCGKVAQLLP